MPNHRRRLVSGRLEKANGAGIHGDDAPVAVEHDLHIGDAVQDFFRAPPHFLRLGPLRFGASQGRPRFFGFHALGDVPNKPAQSRRLARQAVVNGGGDGRRELARRAAAQANDNFGGCVRAGICQVLETGLEAGEVRQGDERAEAAFFQKARRDVQQLGHGPVGFQNDAVDIRDEVAVGGELEQVLVAPALGFQAQTTAQQLFVLHPQFFIGDSQLFQRRLQLFQCLRQQAARAGRLFVGLSSVFGFVDRKVRHDLCVQTSRQQNVRQQNVRQQNVGQQNVRLAAPSAE